MSDALAGRPPAHLAARLARHVAPDLRIAASKIEWVVARPIDGGNLQQRISRHVRAAAAAAALARPPRREILGITVPTPANPAPQTFWGPGGPVPDAALPCTDLLRRDSARALQALKGLPAALAFLDAGGAWLLDADGDAVLRVGRPPAGEVRWRHGPPRIFLEPSETAQRLHALLPDGRQDLPPLADLGTAHARLRHGLGETAVQALHDAMPLSGARLRIHHTPRLFALLRLTPSGRAFPVLLAAFP
jgi:hypothetical protein